MVKACFLQPEVFILNWIHQWSRLVSFSLKCLYLANLFCKFFLALLKKNWMFMVNSIPLFSYYYSAVVEVVNSIWLIRYYYSAVVVVVNSVPLFSYYYSALVLVVNSIILFSYYYSAVVVVVNSIPLFSYYYSAVVVVVNSIPLISYYYSAVVVVVNSITFELLLQCCSGKKHTLFHYYYQDVLIRRWS